MMKLFPSYPFGDLRRPNIAGILDDMIKAEPPMFLYIADGFSRKDVGPIFAEEDIVSFGHLLLKGSRSQEYLKDGAGFKDIGNHPISPCVRWSIPKSIGVKGGVIGHG